MRHLKKKTWPYQVTVLGHNPGVIYNWCKNNAGQFSKDWYSYLENGETTYAFNDRNTVLLFRLTFNVKGKI